MFCTQPLQLHRLHSVQSHYSTVTTAPTCHCRVSEHYTFFLSGHKSVCFFHILFNPQETHIHFHFHYGNWAPVCGLDKMTEDLICARFQI